MKITVECIDHNIVDMITQTGTLCDVIGVESEQEFLLWDAAYIRGALDLADRLKAVIYE